MFHQAKAGSDKKNCGFDQKVECNQRNLTCWKPAIWISKNMDVTLLTQPKPTWECGYASRSNSDAIAQQPYPGAMATLLQELRVGDHPSTAKISQVWEYRVWEDAIFEVQSCAACGMYFQLETGLRDAGR